MNRRIGFSQAARFTLAVIVLLMAGCAPAAEKSQATSTPLPTQIVSINPTYKVQRGEVVDQLQFSGHITPVEQQDTFFKVNGRVRKVYVKEGIKVKAGQVLADLENIAEVGRQLELKKLDVIRMQILVDNAERNLNIFKLDANRWLSSYADELAIKMNELALAKIDLQQTSLGLDELQAQEDAAQIVSPLDGQVIALNTAEGQEVEAYAPMIVVADTNQIEVGASMIGTDYNRLEVGMPALISPFNAPGKIINGSVRRLPPLSGSADSDRTLRISLGVPPEQAGFKLGDVVTVAVVLQRKENALWLPPQVIHDVGGRKFALVQNGNFQERVDVKLGIQSADRVEILEGLSEGQVVIAP
jgi:membrane fusion protein, macrolide-specific efflux system